jgi:cytoskeletal protein CcmA (bactofilin family)
VLAADLSAKDVLVLGTVHGNIFASGRLELRAGCQVAGDVRALRLAIEDNAVFRGKVDLSQAPAQSPVKAGDGAIPAPPPEAE